MPAARIVKLVPIGQPEDRMFEEIIVGGTDDLSALADFVGWHLERFTGLTTDALGQVTVSLSDTPTAITSCFCFVAEDERIVAPLTLTGAPARNLKVQKRKLLYDKANNPGSTSVTGAPGGVTVASSSGQSTGATTAINQSTAVNGDAAAFSGVGSGDAQRTGTAHTHTQDPHAHTMNVLYQHGHTLTHTATSLVAAASEATVLLVLYR
jgi:hypothetical protein